MLKVHIANYNYVEGIRENGGIAAESYNTHNPPLCLGLAVGYAARVAEMVCHWYYLLIHFYS